MEGRTTIRLGAQPVVTLAIIVSVTIWSVSASFNSLAGEERLIGWQGDTFKPTKPKTPFISVISWRPRAFVIRNFLSEQECTHIADMAQVHMRRSTVVAQNGSSVLDDYRTSFGTFLNRHSTPVIAAVEERVAQLTHVPVVYQEDMQVLRYGLGQYYHRHTDSLEDDSPRLATALLYLSDPEVGGETAFPRSRSWVHPDMPRLFGPFSDCVQGNVAFKPRRGDALLFWSVLPDGRHEDPLSEHEGCPVVRGVKWTATVWVHTQPFRPEEWDPVRGTFTRRDAEEDPGLCTDRHPECARWREAGECDRNAAYMRGDASQVGSCRKTCGECEVCDPRDRACYERNRERQGYLVYRPEELLEGRRRREARERGLAVQLGGGEAGTQV
ncbi:hypothetical protein Agub_g1961 [Astrephomene gubernaculifera]|uniref:Fe2OG dioxygenase domain-containing protein n=1 Tax=Astrephomene gubernaculifera TaxID=47775 RepID=A0AAD3DIK0_9CHLO|nr:hypothetical protein Agub_g1961 [Astrephomene gubernaculifera]